MVRIVVIARQHIRLSPDVDVRATEPRCSQRSSRRWPMLDRCGSRILLELADQSLVYGAVGCKRRIPSSRWSASCGKAVVP